MQLAATLGWTSLPWLASLRQPTLIMAGDDDPLVPMINARIMQWLIPDARIADARVRTSVPHHAARAIGRHRRRIPRGTPSLRGGRTQALFTPPFRFQEKLMNDLAIARTPSACDAPLSIGQILAHGLATAARSRRSSTAIVCATRMRRSASACIASRRRSSTLGVRPGATVAMMDWDSHRYLECFFAVPMMGAVLHTVNIRHLARAGALHDQPRQGRRHPRQRRIPAVARVDPREDPARREARADQRRRGDAAHEPRLRRRIRVDARCAPRRHSISRSSTKTRAPRRSTRRARPDCPRASTTATASSCCTRWP